MDNRSIGGIGWHLLAVSTASESSPMVTPFHLSVFCYRRWVLSTERLLNGKRFYPLLQRLFLQESRLTRTFLVKPLILFLMVRSNGDKILKME